eukprot:TRINITY_DN10651_c0_g1_i1.p1 TRINITY_DN10651_c0_g1~~TRINITY_DN10651_c0_g1_i1.p1  ORF type:complete len:404 (+),score=72.57 TRINITY_DN10651_c0_g1_i1:22-1233(+)
MHIALVCDFCHPNLGGIESHLLKLSSELCALGHHIVIVTHSYPGYHGRHCWDDGIVIYYVPLPTIARQNTVPLLFTSVYYLKRIFDDERIDIVHGHSAFSTLCHEAILIAQQLKLKTVFTDHSLVDLEQWHSYILNSFLSITLCHADAAISVSNASKENLCVRSLVPPDKIAIIPNAVDTQLFTPASTPPSTDHPVLVVVSRLYPRKGVDLLTQALPLILRKRPDVKVIIAGDGPLRVDLEEMIEANKFEHRIRLLGAVSHPSIPAVLQQGHLFLNCSRTEAFCMAVLEAVSCGLMAVSTNVGGVPEILPSDMLILAEPDAHDIAQHTLQALDACMQVDRTDYHRRVTSYYSWSDVACRTLDVYEQCMLAKKDAEAGATFLPIMLLVLHWAMVAWIRLLVWLL